MLFDIVLPSIITVVTIAIVWLYAKLEIKIKSLFEEKEFSIRDAVLLVIAMGAMITVIVFVPHQAIQVLFLTAYAFVLFLLTYIASEKWYFSLLPPIVFMALYVSPFWGITLVNIFAIIFAVFISVYLGGLFSWKTVLVFAALLTVMDVIQVFATGFMGASAEKMVDLKLPILIQVPTFPLQGAIRLGLGDIFLAGLLAIQTAQKYNQKAGVISAISIGFAFLIFEISILNYEFAGYFPATLVVVGGWLLGLGLQRLFMPELAS